MALAGSAVSKAWSGYLLHDGLAMAPDGHRLFVVSRATGTHLHAPVILDFATIPPTVTNLPPFFTAESDYGTGQFAWTPDGQAISFIRRQGLVDNLWAMPVGGGAPRALTHFKRLQIAGYAWSPRGVLAISRGRNNTDAVLATPVR